jgi:hypothetical protein
VQDIETTKIATMNRNQNHGKEITTIPQQENKPQFMLQPLAACKRVIGVEGDVVLRYGEYAPFYSKNGRDDGGIRWPTSTTTTTDSSSRVSLSSSLSSWDTEKEDDSQRRHSVDDNDKNGKEPMTAVLPTKQKNWNRTLVVPPGHVWLEGDCPLLSIDSRHVGPIPMEWVRGKLVTRLWPLRRDRGSPSSASASASASSSPDQDLDQVSSSSSSTLLLLTSGTNKSGRPIPHPHLEDYLGPKYNLYSTTTSVRSTTTTSSSSSSSSK